MDARDTQLEISISRRRAITAGLLLHEPGVSTATVVSTAMPTVIATLGAAHYSWVFSAYLLTSTAAVPIWGACRICTGAAACILPDCVSSSGPLWAPSESMEQLIVFRAIQGPGGAIIPLSMTMVGELYTLEERARTQALFSGVWGIASIGDRSSAAT